MTPRMIPMTRLGRFQRGEDAAVEPLTAQRQVGAARPCQSWWARPWW
jgi:hypothetical protein